MGEQEETLGALQRLFSGLGAKRLLVHAIYESKKYFWRTGSGRLKVRGKQDAALAEGMSPEDIVMEAMRRTITGDRPWNREKYPDIANHLKWVITSLASNLAESADNHAFRSMPVDAEGNVLTDRLSNGGEHRDVEIELPMDEKELQAMDERPPEAKFLAGIKGPEADDLTNKVLDAISDDAQLLEVFQHLMDEKKPRDIMVAMGLSDKEVYRLTQKLRRRITQCEGLVSAGGIL